MMPGSPAAHRYMAPLKVTGDCLQCHERQGYVTGQVLGGISVTMPTENLLQIRDADRIRSSVEHLLMFGAVAGLLYLLVRRTRNHMRTLEKIAIEQEQVILDRTHDLSQTNMKLEDQLAAGELAAAVFENAVEAIIVADEQRRSSGQSGVFADDRLCAE